MVLLVLLPCYTVSGGLFEGCVCVVCFVVGLRVWLRWVGLLMGIVVVTDLVGVGYFDLFDLLLGNELVRC